MLLKKWDSLPENIRKDAVKPYYDELVGRKGSIFAKLFFDRIVAALMLIGLSPVFIALAIAIKLDSPGEVFFRQERVTRYGKKFRIYKFRTMVTNAETLGTQVTTQNDARVTGIGSKLRGCRLDELPQLINILKGEMSFVGTRPEVPRYVDCYTDEMMATLLLPAGVTSEASIEYKEEDKLLADAADANRTYIEEVLPQKMQWNYKGLKDFGFWNDIKVMLKTVKAVM